MSAAKFAGTDIEYRLKITDEATAIAKRAATEIPEALRRIRGPVAAAVEDLESSLGRRSTAGKLLETLRGAGAVAAVGIGVEVANRVTEKAAEFADELRRGEKSAGELAEDFVRTVPIIGSAYNMLRNTAEILTGEGVQLERIKQSAEDIDRVTESWKRGAEAVRQSHQETADLIEQMVRQRRLLGMPDMNRQLLGVAFNETDTSKDVAAKAKTRIKDLMDKNEPDIRKLYKEARQIEIPELVETRGEFGEVSTNRDQVNEAIARREEIYGRIRQIEQQQAADIKKIQADAGEQVTAVVKTGWAQRLQIVKDGAAKVWEGMQRAGADAYQKASEDEQRKIADTEQMMKQRRRDELEQIRDAQRGQHGDAGPGQFAPGDALLSGPHMFGDIATNTNRAPDPTTEDIKRSNAKIEQYAQKMADGIAALVRASQQPSDATPLRLGAGDKS